MPNVNEKIKAIGQGEFLGKLGYSAGGVCYYMCNFVESEKGPWDQPNTFANAKAKAKSFSEFNAMMAFAKAQNLKNKGGEAHGSAQQIPNTAIAGALATGRIHRMAIWIGAANENPANANSLNHAVMALTGDGNEILYFEPNFGFWAPKEDGASNRVALENAIKAQYVAIGMHAENFKYLNLRGINQKTPKTPG
jgi:hypothetical protein